MLVSRSGLAKFYQMPKDYDEALRSYQRNVSLLKRLRDEASESDNNEAALIVANYLKSIGEGQDHLGDPH